MPPGLRPSRHKKLPFILKAPSVILVTPYPMHMFVCKCNGRFNFWFKVPSDVEVRMWLLPLRDVGVQFNNYYSFSSRDVGVQFNYLVPMSCELS